MTDTLSTRDGIPDTLAYLRAAYPRPEWHAHRNFGELSDFWLRVHESLRSHGEALGRATSAYREGRSDAAAFQRFFVPRMNHFLQHLNGHHQIEDQHYFPKYRALDDRMIAGFDLLDADHQHIHAALIASAQSAQTLVTSLAQPGDASRRAADAHAADADRLLALLLRHLADEEDLVIPAMLHHGERSVG